MMLLVVSKIIPGGLQRYEETFSDIRSLVLSACETSTVAPLLKTLMKSLFYILANTDDQEMQWVSSQVYQLKKEHEHQYIQCIGIYILYVSVCDFGFTVQPLTVFMLLSFKYSVAPSLWNRLMKFFHWPAVKVENSSMLSDHRLLTHWKPVWSLTIPD